MACFIQQVPLFMNDQIWELGSHFTVLWISLPEHLKLKAQLWLQCGVRTWNGHPVPTLQTPTSLRRLQLQSWKVLSNHSAHLMAYKYTVSRELGRRLSS